uniref:Phosphonate ABC transporter permease n=1 Tax=Anaerobacillus isosaccharinicus TaxID=1532552 RepID=A0A1S2LIM0_9BACI|nr:ABC transporter permease subunit [Anaerobacillus isosaccharinicus]QOY38583.1 ABC transporter permease subunit [Anaerobacillus isosaccharinicus]
MLIEQYLAKPIKVKQLTKSVLVIRATLLSLLLITIYGFYFYDYKGINVFEAIIGTIANFKIMFTEAHFNNFTFTEGVYAATVTLSLAVLTTLFGAMIALFLGLLAARNLSTPGVSNAIRGVVAIVRAVQTVLWVLIFAIAAGLGSVAAVVGMTFHSVSYLVKVYSESFEELDEGVIEALKASGASWWQIVFQAVIPSTMSYLISWTFLRFEINFGVAIAMGAAAAAGGIGFELFMASAFYYDIRELGTITYFVLFIAIMLEVLATKIKSKLRVSH